MIYIQKKDDSNIAHHFDCSCAMYGAIEQDLPYKLISYDEIEKYSNLIKTNLFVGSTEFMSKVFSFMNKSPKVPKNSNRSCRILTLKQAKEFSKERSIFIKPTKIKLFTGFVLDQYSYNCINILPDNTEVMVYDPFIESISSEWRLYINNNKIVDARNYAGDFMITPDWNYAKQVLEENRSNFPISYTIDIGILKSGKNEVIEFNDMWAIGNYGIPNDLYIRLLKDRYWEIIRHD